MPKKKKSNSGQALIEYALLIFLITGVFLTMDFQIKRVTGKVWKNIAKNIAPGCPGCEAPDSIK